MYCFNFFRNQLWQHLISYNSSRNMDMCLLEVSMCEKCRSSHFQSERGGGSKKFEYWGVKKFGIGGLPVWGVLLLGVSTPLHAMQCDPGWKLKSPLAEFKRFFFWHGRTEDISGHVRKHLRTKF